MKDSTFLKSSEWVVDPIARIVIYSFFSIQVTMSVMLKSDPYEFMNLFHSHAI